MNDDDKKQLEVSKLQEEVHAGLSRRKFLDRLKAVGVGFGAAAVVGVDAASAHTKNDPTLALKSTNPALGAIVDDADKSADPAEQHAQYYYYRRFYRRYGRVWYRRYARFFYRRYARYYYRRW